jgi:hypothetical protein
MIACSADMNSQIKKEAIDAGFDLVIQAPLTESFLKEVVEEIKRRENKKIIMKKVLMDLKEGWKS